MRVENITCPGCGAPWTLDMKECPSCHRPVVITTFNSVYSMPMPETHKYASTYKKVLSDDEDNGAVNSAIAMCYLKLKMYDKALASFEKAIRDDFDNSETYFWAAVCTLGGKKAFLNSRNNIDQAETYINAAMMIEPRGIYLYLLAYLRYDFYERKYLNVSPDYRQCLQQAFGLGVSDSDLRILFDTLGVANPFS